MSMRAIKDEYVVTASFVPLLRTATVSGTGIDLAGVNSNMFVFAAGANTDGTHTPKLQDSADNSTWADVAAADQVGSLIAIAANSVQKVSYIGSKRYVRQVVTVTGSPATGATYTGYAVTKSRKQP